MFAFGEKVEKVATESKKAAIIETFDEKNTYVLLATIHGDILMQLYPDDAPNTVKNFLFLVDKDFYNGLSFHRIINNEILLGGDPLGDSSGGPGYKIKAEFNYRPHETGTLAMARARDPNSAGSQFYICLIPQPKLDGNYTVFGQVIFGMDNVKKIKPGDKILRMKICDKEGKAIWYNRNWFADFKKIEE